MATLHVRNFPDALYARLRASAARNGRSIGAEAIFHLQSALTSSTTAGDPPVGRRRGAPAKPFERFSPRARQVVVDAQAEARELGHDAVGTEHLLLGLLHEPATPASRLLADAGLTLESTRREIEEAHGTSDTPAGQALHFTPGAKKAMELALRCSLDMNAANIWPFHLLFGVVQEEAGLGARILVAHGLDPKAVLRQAHSVTRPAHSFFEADERFRVIELTGDPGEWEAQLNELASLGYRLEQIVEKRAIFSGPDDDGVDRLP